MALTQIIDTIVEAEAINTLKPALAPLAAMTKDFKADYSRSATFKVVSAGSTTQENPTSYSAGAAGTGEPVIVTLAELNHAFVITPADKRNGWKLADLVKTNAVAFSNKVNNKIMAQLPTATVVAGATTAFTGKKLISLAGNVDAEAVGAIMTPDYFYQIVPDSKTALDLTDGAYGYDLGLFKVKSAVLPTGIVGACFAKDGIAVATALPEVPDSIDYQDIELPGLAGLTVRVCNWVNTDTRAEYMSFGIALGAKVLDRSEERRVGKEC